MIVEELTGKQGLAKRFDSKVIAGEHDSEAVAHVNPFFIAQTRLPTSMKPSRAP
jgi:hypothetical protein